MEFGLSEEQRMLDASLRGFVGERLPMERFRKIAETGRGYDDGLWKELLEQGIAGVLVPERFGGGGLKTLDAAVVAEVLGYHAVPVPFTASLVMAPMVLAQSGSESVCADLLPKIANGEARIAVGFSAGAGQTGEARLHFDRDRLNGSLTGVLDAGGATHIISFLADDRAVLVDINQAGTKLDMRRSLDRTRPVCNIEFVDAPAMLLTVQNDPQLVTRVLDTGRLMLAADTLGAAQSMFDKAVAYSQERMQFNRVIGSFQGVKHTLADLVTMLEPCRSLVWYAAHAVDEVPDEARVMTLQAKAHLGDVGREVARLSTEVHGGMGFTDLLGLHYWLKRIAFNRQMLGAPEYCRRELAAARGWLAAGE